MFSWYLVLKYIHILSALVAVGANITYGVWATRMARDPGHTSFVLKGIQFLDNRIANPAYGVLFLTGLIMIFAGNFGLQLWIVVAVVLFIAIAILGFAIFTPLVRNQIRLADAGETASAEFVRLANRSRTLGPILGLLVLVILAMMVFKPTL
ncbi:MAG TPA: DUF2269 family protein [Candidatus Dormibacteraeota bacterium]|nr:DUF2269 family protein [Candidatus Dormibacteraeota bacterium]